MDPAAITAVVVIVVSAGASFFFALAETALFSLSKWQIRQLAEREPRHGAVVAKLLAEPHGLLATMVMGSTFATAAMLVVGFWAALHEDWSFISTLFSLLVLVLFGCEVLPKTLAVRKPEQWALRVARPLLFLDRFGHFFRQLAQKISSIMLALIPIKPQPTLSDGEYKELVELAYQQGTLAESEKEIILQIINLDRRTVKEVMRPRSQMSCIPDTLTVEEMVAAARRYRHRRLPMYDETPDTIVGILNTRALLLDPEIDLADAIEFPSFVPQTMNLLQLLKSMQRQQRSMAIVADEFGGTAGLVTIEDILAELIGKIRSEQEPSGFIMEKLGPGRWRVNGTMRLDDFRREYPALGDVPDVETMGGLLTNLLGVVPSPGESAAYRGLKLTAHATDERRVRELLVEQAKP